MNALDFVVLIGSMLGIAGYGIWRTRGRRTVNTYLRGDGRTPWFAIGLSVMATQASAITFLSTPGQGYLGGLGFVQIYFGVPVALILIAIFFLPVFRKLNVYTAYEFLGKRFDGKTRLLGAGLFLLQRGLGAGLTIYAPAIVLTTVFGWPLNLTIICSGLLVIIYTVLGGSDAVTVTQKYQFGIIFAGMITAFCLLVLKLPAGLTFKRHFHARGRIPQAQRGEFFHRCSRALHVLVGTPRWHFFDVVVFRHRPIAGPTLSFRRVVARKPAWPHVQCRLQNPNAILHSTARCFDLCLLSI